MEAGTVLPSSLSRVVLCKELKQAPCCEFGSTALIHCPGAPNSRKWVLLSMLRTLQTSKHQILAVTVVSVQYVVDSAGFAQSKVSYTYEASQ